MPPVFLQTAVLLPLPVSSPQESPPCITLHCTSAVHVLPDCVPHRSETNILQRHLLQRNVWAGHPGQTHNYNRRSHHPPRSTHPVPFQMDRPYAFLPALPTLPGSSHLPASKAHRPRHLPGQNALWHMGSHPDCSLSPHRNRFFLLPLKWSPWTSDSVPVRFQMPAPPPSGWLSLPSDKKSSHPVLLQPLSLPEIPLKSSSPLRLVPGWTTFSSKESSGKQIPQDLSALYDMETEIQSL